MDVVHAADPLRAAIPVCADRCLRLVRLDDDDREKLRAHLSRLDADDRRMRFMRVMSDDDITTLVRSDTGEKAVRLGLVDPGGQVVALVEGYAYRVGARTDMELAFSTDQGWRRRGLATFLFHEIARLGRDQGVARLVLQCESRNLSMRRVLRNVDAQTAEDSGEVSAIWCCAEQG